MKRSKNEKIKFAYLEEKARHEQYVKDKTLNKQHLDALAKNEYYLICDRLAVARLNFSQIIGWDKPYIFCCGLPNSFNLKEEVSEPIYLFDQTIEKIYKVKELKIRKFKGNKYFPANNFINVSLKVEEIKGNPYDYFCKGSILLLNL